MARQNKLKNNIKSDLILKNFWRDNDRFADLFNACVFNGKQILKPEDLTEVDTDISSLIKFNGHAETIQKVLDVVKKTAYGVDFVILGIENQQRIHYAMPLRHMIGDAFSYLKEYNELAAGNKKEKNLENSDEFLSKLRKTDRLHAVMTICVYYGEKEWDGPRSLLDMLTIPEEWKSLVSDYKFNLIEVRESEHLKFHNQDVKTIFNISRFIYDKEYDKLNNIYKEQTISTELAMVIGAITETQKLIDDALKSKKKGEQLNMCKALEELEERGRQRGEIQIKILQIQKKIKKNKQLSQIADEIEEDEENIKDLYELIKKYPEKTKEEIYDLIEQ